MLLMFSCRLVGDALDEAGQRRHDQYRVLMELEERIHTLRDVTESSGKKIHTAADQIAAELNVGKVAVTQPCEHCGKPFLVEHYILRNHQQQCAAARTVEALAKQALAEANEEAAAGIAHSLLRSTTVVCVLYLLL